MECRVLVYCSGALLKGRRAPRALCKALVAAFREHDIAASVLLVRLRGLSLPFIESADALEPLDGYVAYPEAFSVLDASALLLVLDGSPRALQPSPRALSPSPRALSPSPASPRALSLSPASSLHAHLEDVVGEMTHGRPKGWRPLLAWAPLFAEQDGVEPLRALTASLGAACAVLDPRALTWSRAPAKPLVELLVASRGFREWREEAFRRSARAAGVLERRP